MCLVGCVHRNYAEIGCVVIVMYPLDASLEAIKFNFCRKYIQCSANIPDVPATERKGWCSRVMRTKSKKEGTLLRVVVVCNPSSETMDLGKVKAVASREGVVALSPGVVIWEGGRVCWTYVVDTSSVPKYMSF